MRGYINKCMIPTGCKNIDRLIGGGLRGKIITQLYGPAGSGKSNICMQSLCNCVKAGKRAVYVDTEGGFSEKRLRQIAGNDFKRVLENTYFYEVVDFEEQGAIIKQLEKHDDIALIIVDSVTSLYRLQMSDDRYKETNRELGRQLSTLLAYARKNNIPVLVTNQVYTDIETDEIEAVGGDVMRYSSKVVVELQKDGYARNAILRKHLFKKDGDSAAFSIIEEGVVDE
jgi:DNA repair protein RadB